MNVLKTIFKFLAWFTSLKTLVIRKARMIVVAPPREKLVVWVRKMLANEPNKTMKSNMFQLSLK